LEAAIVVEEGKEERRGDGEEVWQEGEMRRARNGGEERAAEDICT
jgi:hypothetical protein